MKPSYLRSKSTGNLKAIKNKLLLKLKNCKICPRSCSINRIKGEKGFCNTGRYAHVASKQLHFGEEPPLVGRKGSGTIFFSYCNLGCLYCQNYTISHYGQGNKASPKKLAKKMINLQNKGAHNINFVTPTHIIPQIIEALDIAVDMGLNIPLVYNSGGYDKKETLQLLNGIFDIYMPDIKYSNSPISNKYSKAKDYWSICKEALKEMQKQVGELKVDSDGIAKKGVIVRHLILPNNISGSKKIIDFILNNISKNTYVNIMDQYYPCFKSSGYKELSRRITPSEYKNITEYAKKRGLNRGF